MVNEFINRKISLISLTVCASSLTFLSAYGINAHADVVNNANNNVYASSENSTTNSLKTKQFVLTNKGNSNSSTTAINEVHDAKRLETVSSSNSNSVNNNSVSMSTVNPASNNIKQSSNYCLPRLNNANDNSFKNNDGHWTVNHQGYYGDNGQLVTGYQEIDGQHYFFNQQGQIQSDIQQIGDTYYYFDPKTYQQVNDAYVWSTKWNNWYMFGVDGRIVTDIYRYHGTYYYFDPQTYLKVTDAYVWSNNWNNWYMFDQDGQIVTDIYKYKGTYYFFDPQTYLKVTDSYVWSNKWHNWYMFDQDGQIVTDIYKYKGTYYFFDPQTYLKVTDSYVWSNKYHHWYMFDQNGQIVTDIYKYKGTYYFFDPQTYLKVTDSYVWSNKWHNWYMFDQDGQIVTDIYKYKGTYYFFDPQTYLKVTDSYVWSNKYHHWYMFGPDGRIVSGLYSYRGATYYFDPVTYLKETNTTININGVKYNIDNDGLVTVGINIKNLYGSHLDFVNSLIDGAIQGWKNYGILPSVTIAQAILESGWGQSYLSTAAHNLFGIKGSYNGQSIILPTQEWNGYDYVTIDDSFRRYDNNSESIIDHGYFLTVNSRYNNLHWQRDYHIVCELLQQDGYATAPTYASSLINIIDSYGLNSIDQSLF